MRMWLVDPKIMCRKHLLGEHVEHHMFVGTINKKLNMRGYANNNLIEPQKLQERHLELVDEMISRGYNHNSPLDEVDLSYLDEDIQMAIVDVDSSLKEILRRCPECAARYKELYPAGL